MEEFEADIFEKNEFEHRDLSILKTFLPLLPYQIPIPMWETNFMILDTKQSSSKEQQWNYTLMGKWKTNSRNIMSLDTKAGQH